MNFTFLPSSSVLIHSSSGIFVSLQARSGMSRVYVVRCQKSRIGNEKSPSRDLAFERCTENYNGELPCRESLPERTTPESLDGGRGERSGPLAVLFASPHQQPELRRLAKLIVRTVH